jgi:hypothetical protein
MKFRSTSSASSLAALSQSTRWAASEMPVFHPLRAFLPGPNDDCCGSQKQTIHPKYLTKIEPR